VHSEDAETADHHGAAPDKKGMVHPAAE
jgi:hypothetical protein